MRRITRYGLMRDGNLVGYTENDHMLGAIKLTAFPDESQLYMHQDLAIVKAVQENTWTGDEIENPFAGRCRVVKYHIGIELMPVKDIETEG
jgi:hypothetical protein